MMRASTDVGTVSGGMPSRTRRTWRIAGRPIAMSREQTVTKLSRLVALAGARKSTQRAVSSASQRPSATPNRLCKQEVTGSIPVGSI